MPTNSYKQVIESEMRLKTTDELLDIWVKNNRAEWTEEAFEVIHNILLERLETIPIQNKPNYKRIDLWSEDIHHFFRSTGFLTSWLGMIFFLLLLIGMAILQLFFGKDVPIIFINILLIATLPLPIISGIFMILRREVARPGTRSITGWAAVAEGIFIVFIFGVGEVIALVFFILRL